jgi:membrane-bound lytic murein transglycosylase B
MAKLKRRWRPASSNRATRSRFRPGEDRRAELLVDGSDSSFLLPIYQAAGMQYGIRWEVLAGINEIETDYGATSTSPPSARWAGCSSCPPPGRLPGVDANQDGVKDPFNPVDAIFAAARHLQAAAATRMHQGRLRLQHADWYVDRRS